MDQYSEYNAQLNDYITFSFGIIILVCVVVLALIVVCIKFKCKQMIIVSLIGGVLISLIIYSSSILPYQMDIKENSYKTYTGEFFVEEYYFVNRSGTYMLIKLGSEDNSVRYRVLCDVPLIENSKMYNGTIVYSKRSKCLVNIDIIEN